MKQLRIMYFPGKISGGVGAVVMNIFRNIDHEMFKIDFCVPDADEGKFDEEIMASGSKVFHTPQIRKVGLYGYYKAVIKILRENGKYDAVHIHSVHMGAITLLAAKKAGISNRYYHVHNTKDAALDSLPCHSVLENLLKCIICKNATRCLACGREAGQYIYNNKRDFTVINNAIDLTKYYPDAQKRRETREKMYIDNDTLVIGNIARFVDEKNQMFFVNLAKTIKLEKMKMIILLIGDGPLQNIVEKKAECERVEDIIHFMGNRNDTAELYNVMDVFCLPSIFEGLPLTLMEAQASGIPIVVSDSVTNEANIGVGSYIRISLQETTEKWLECIKKSHDKKVTDKDIIKKCFCENEYEIKSIVKKIQNIYLGGHNNGSML